MTMNLDESTGNIRTIRKGELMPRDLKDSAQHAVAHELLEARVSDLSDTFKRSIRPLVENVERIGQDVQDLKMSFAVTAEKIKHLATDDDVVRAVSHCQANNHRPINWKAVGAVITATVAAIGAAIVSVLQAI